MFYGLLSSLTISKDSYFNMDKVVNRLCDEFREYGRIVIAYDYDDTISPNSGDCCDDVIELLQEASKIPEADFIIFTARTPKDYDKITNYVNHLGIRYDAINRNIPRLVDTFGDGKESKVYYSIFLDDRAGLALTYLQLKRFINWYYTEGRK